MGYGSIHGVAVPSNALVADIQSLGNLKMDAGKQTPESIQETAKQFESLFMKELLKSMREATVKSGMLDSAGGDLGTDLLDQQFAVQMSGQPGGLSTLIAQQLTRQMGGADATRPANPQPADPARNVGPVGKTGAADKSGATALQATTQAATTRSATSRQADFVGKHSAAANNIERATGIPAAFMLGQAGHETGWGKFEIKGKGGAQSFNLFGIKAGSSWTGKVAEITTTEYVDGVAQKKVAKFRAYDSYEDSFKDYARLISESPRYAKVKQQTGSAHAFASGLQKAGYATDPEYANKLSRAINTTLQLRRVQV
jgi:flagellar protein FlgJ